MYAGAERAVIAPAFRSSCEMHADVDVGEVAKHRHLRDETDIAKKTRWYTTCCPKRHRRTAARRAGAIQPAWKEARVRHAIETHNAVTVLNEQFQSQGESTRAERWRSLSCMMPCQS